MATVGLNKVNPVYKNQARSFLGKSLTFVNVDFNVDTTIDDDPAGSNLPNEVMDEVLKAVALRATPVLVSEVTGSGQLLTISVEGEFPSDDYNSDGTSTTFAAQLQVDIRALGTVDAIDLSGTIVTSGVTYKADQVYSSAA